MKFSMLLSSTAVLLSAHSTTASDAHRRMHNHNHIHALEKKHAHGHLHVRETEEAAPVKRGGQCQFPTDDPNLVAVTPGSKNAGWALPPDQACEPDMYCPIACKPGMVMAQWEPGSTYTYPQSMNGGLYCDSNGNIKKPFPDKPNCVPGTGTVQAVNKCGKKMSFCQTVLPGREDMIIPTLVQDTATLAVPGPSYWGSTAAHFYVNPPGSEEADCIWGDQSNPIGNWSPYVAGTNTDSQGLSYVKLALNPIWLDSPLKASKPNFGLRIECPGGGCNGLPCSIDISGDSPTVKSSSAASGAGGASFCVVTVPKGSSANIVAYSADGGSGNSDNPPPKQEKPKPSPKPEPPPVVPTTSSAPPPPPTSTYTPPPPQPTTTTEKTTTQVSTTSEVSSSSSREEQPSYMPGIFRENGTDPTPTLVQKSTSTAAPSQSTSDVQEKPATKDEDNEAGRKGGRAPLAGLVVAFVAAACFF